MGLRSRFGYAIAATAGRLPGLSDERRNVLDFHALSHASSTKQVARVVRRGLRRVHGKDTVVAIDPFVDVDSAREMGLAILVCARYYPEVPLEGFRIDDSARDAAPEFEGSHAVTFTNKPQVNRTNGRALLWFDSDEFSAANRAEMLQTHRAVVAAGQHPVQNILGPAFVGLHEFLHAAEPAVTVNLSRWPREQRDRFLSTRAYRIASSVPRNERSVLASEIEARYMNDLWALQNSILDPDRLQAEMSNTYQAYYGIGQGNLLTTAITQVKLGMTSAINVPEEDGDGGTVHLLDRDGLNPTAAAIGGYVMEGLGRPPGDRPPQLIPLLIRMINSVDARTGDTRVRDAFQPPPVAVNPWLATNPAIPAAVNPDPSLAGRDSGVDVLVSLPYRPAAVLAGLDAPLHVSSQAPAPAAQPGAHQGAAIGSGRAARGKHGQAY